MSDIKSESPHLQAEGVQQGGIGRRRLLRAGLAAAPVVLAVSGRSAMAAECPTGLGLSLATMTSINPSGDGVNCIASSHTHTASSSSLGKSPSYWKPNPKGKTFQPPYPWPVAPFDTITTEEHKSHSVEQKSDKTERKANKTEGKSDKTETMTYRWNPGDYLYYKDIAKDADGWDTGAKYNHIFRGSSDSRSFSRILLDDNGSLAWHFCAAYLNAAAMAAGTYVMTKEEVVLLADNGNLVRGGNPLTDWQIKAFLSQTWA